MHILGPGRGAFLEFLRNLTPIILMTSVAVALRLRLDFSRFDLSNWASTGGFFVCALTAVLAFFASMSQFVDNAFGPVLGLDRAIRLLKHRGHSTSVLFRAVALFTWRRSPMVVAEAILVMVVAYAAVLGGAHAAVSAAVTAFHNGVR